MNPGTICTLHIPGKAIDGSSVEVVAPHGPVLCGGKERPGYVVRFVGPSLALIAQLGIADVPYFVRAGQLRAPQGYSHLRVAVAA